MKIAFRILSLLLLAVVATFYAGCRRDDDDQDTEEKKQLTKLVGDWTLQSAEDGQGDRTTDFIDLDENNNPVPLVLHLEGNYTGEGKTYNYSFSGVRPEPSPWPASGTWKFGNPKSTQIIRDPGGVNEITMTYTVTETDLIISFNVPDGSEGWPGGSSRIKNVIGDWQFTFSK